MSDAVLEIVKNKGPVLPIQISKETKLDTLFAAAKLSELVHYKKVKLSHLKIGGSPVYYVEGQEDKLQDKLYDYMKDNEKKAFDLLKEKSVLKDAEQSQEVKNALKFLKDFAKPLNVKANGSSLLFWKWYGADDSEVKDIINELLQPPKPKVEEKKVEVVEKKQEEVAKEPVEEEKVVEKKKQEVKEEIKEKVEEKVKKDDIKAETPEVVQETLTREETQDAGVQKPVVEKEEEVDISYSSDDVSIAFQPSESMQTPLAKEASTKLEEPVDDFYNNVKSFLEPLNVDILEAKVIKKNSELDLIIDMPTPLGVARYYCKAKDKKRLSDGDLSTAFVQGQIRRLPVILLSPGELSKKALDMLGQELKGQILFKSMSKEV